MTYHFITCPAYALPPFRMPWQGPNARRDDPVPNHGGLPTFRREFALRGQVVEAALTATALGVFDLYLGGERVGHMTPEGTIYDELKPGSTDFRHRVHAYTYDVTSYLRHQNKLVAVVSPGWWSGRISFGVFGLEPPAFAAILTLTYADGTTEWITTEEGWESCVAGPILSADLYDGEYVDGRLPHPAGAFDPYSWGPVEAYSYEGVVEPLMGPPVRVRSDLTRRPVSATLTRGEEEDGSTYGALHVLSRRVGDFCERGTLRPGERLILDLGQNIAGRPYLCLNAPSGTEITLLMGEMLNDSGEASRGNDGPRGSVYVASYRSAHSHAVYVASGVHGETFVPLHTYYGFRYAELTASEPCEILLFRGEVLSSDLAETGHIETDHAEVNQLISNIEWGRRGNYLFVPTDCPQRDERLGWSGDTHIFCGAAAYLADIRSFMKKWLIDAADSQVFHDGAYADVAPAVLSRSNPGHGGNTGWGDAAIIIPGILYRMYGDKKIIKTQYPSMERHMEFLASRGYEGGRTWYGDWLAYEPTDKPLIALAYYAGVARLMGEYGRILSENIGDFFATRAAHYEALYADLRAEYRRRYVKDGKLTITTQTSYLLTLKFGLLNEDEIAEATAALVEKIRNNGYLLSTGFLGTGTLANTLSEFGQHQMVYSLLLSTDDPSWLYSVRQGATTIWERWNSYTKEKGFGDVSMNSFNHYAYGAVLEWMFAHMAGIRPDPEMPGFQNILIAPTPDLRKGEDLPAGQSRIGHVKAHYDSIRGRIESEWGYIGGAFYLRCVVPDGCTASISFPLLKDGIEPAPERESIAINGIVYTARDLLASKDGYTWTFDLPGGRYDIR